MISIDEIKLIGRSEKIIICVYFTSRVLMHYLLVVLVKVALACGLGLNLLAMLLILYIRRCRMFDIRIRTTTIS